MLSGAAQDEFIGELQVMVLKQQRFIARPTRKITGVKLEVGVCKSRRESGDADIAHAILGAVVVAAEKTVLVQRVARISKAGLIQKPAREKVHLGHRVRLSRRILVVRKIRVVRTRYNGVSVINILIQSLRGVV